MEIVKRPGTVFVREYGLMEYQLDRLIEAMRMAGDKTQSLVIAPEAYFELKAEIFKNKIPGCYPGTRYQDDPMIFKGLKVDMGLGDICSECNTQAPGDGYGRGPSNIHGN